MRAAVAVPVARRGVTDVFALPATVAVGRDTVARADAARDAPAVVVRAADALRVVVPRDVTLRTGAMDVPPDATAREVVDVRPVALRAFAATGKAAGWGATFVSKLSDTGISASVISDGSMSEYSIASS